MILGFIARAATTAQYDAIRSMLSSNGVTAKVDTVIHGADVYGADLLFDAIVRNLLGMRDLADNDPTHGVIIEVYPTNKAYAQFYHTSPTGAQRRAHLTMKEQRDRNAVIVDRSDVIVACLDWWEEEEERKNIVWTAILYAKKLGKPLVVVARDGSRRHFIFGQEFSLSELRIMLRLTQSMTNTQEPANDDNSLRDCLASFW